MQGQGGGSTNISCLEDAGSSSHRLISLQMCGNGIVEEGEDCDPGQNVTSPCCNSATCKFTAGAKCDPSSSPCCTQQCNFSPATQVCRPARDAQCDTAENCTGTSASCPADVFAKNGQGCGSNGLKCASGVCTSVTKQCQTLGAALNLSEACPDMNDSSCRVACKDPSSSGSCKVLQAMLIDGSPCGFGGSCQAGRCQPGSLLDTAKAWFVQNLQISIPVTVVVGIVAIFLLWALVAALYKRCSRRSDQRMSVRVQDPAFLTSRHQRLGSLDSATGPFTVSGGGSSGRRRNANISPLSGPLPPPPALQPVQNVAYRRGPGSMQQRTSYQPTNNNESTDFARGSPSNWVDDRVYNGQRLQS